MNRRNFLLSAAASCLPIGHRGILTPPSGDDEFPIDAAEARLKLAILDLRQRPGTPERYGAKSDCAGNSPEQLAAATDSTVGIQSAIDYALYGHGSRRAELQSGGYKTTDTLHLGYGSRGYGSVVVQGQGYKFRGEQGFSGTAIFATRTDRPAVNIQGARGTVLRDISIIGRLQKHIVENRMCDSLLDSRFDDTSPLAWDDPALGGTACDSRYAPYAGVTIDAYAGVAPPTHYPNVRYPAFLGAITQYEKLTSSDVSLENCYIAGFTVAVANQPCDFDINGDFTSLRRVFIEWCKWGISVGNSQSRNVSLHEVKMFQVHTCLTNRRHGRQIGRFGGTISDLSVVNVMRIFDFIAYYAEPIHFSTFYGESLWCIGEIESSNSTEGSIVFTGGEFHFNLQNDIRGHPGRLLRASYGPLDLQLRGCYFLDYSSVIALDATGITFDGCYFRRDSPRVHTYEQIAHNALAGGLVTRGLETPAASRLKCSYYNLDTGKRESIPQYTDRWTKSGRPYCISYFVERVVTADQRAVAAAVPFVGGASGKRALTSVALAGRILTLKFRGMSEELAMQQGPNPGDVIFDDDSASVFFVSARSGSSVTAILQNNYRLIAGRAETLTPFSASAGTLFWRNARLYAGAPATQVPSGDAVLVNDAGDRRGMEFFVRSPPPNT